MPADLVSFLRWIGLLEVEKPEPINWDGVWYKDGEPPF